MEKCKICNCEFKNPKALSSHFNSKHNISSKDYYDKYILEADGDKCFVCGNLTSFRNLSVGYLENCSMECRDKNKSIERGFWKGKKQSDSTIKKRIENTNQKKKELQRKKTMMEKFGVDNPSKMIEVSLRISESNKGKKSPRTEEWQKNIINSKKRNGTIYHNEITKRKIKDSLIEFHTNNKDKDRFISYPMNTKHLNGWFKGLYFRSSLELSFLINNCSTVYESCENNQYGIEYNIGNRCKMYYPDFTDGKTIYEVKPTSLLNYKDNSLKLSLGIKKYGNNFVVITEKESPYIPKKIIEDLIKCGDIVLSQSGLKSFEKYRY